MVLLSGPPLGSTAAEGSRPPPHDHGRRLVGAAAAAADARR